MKTLLLQFIGPMQSWGTQSRYSIRETNLEPSKSGVIGLIYSALGKKREEEEIDEKEKPSLERLANLRLGVRIDSAGTMLCDYHTVGGSPPHKAEKRIYLASGKLSDNAVISYRYYLSDAKFLVGLESEDEDLIELLFDKIAKPQQQIFLGRKSFIPSEPVWLSDGLLEMPLEEELMNYPLLDSQIIQKEVVAVLETTPNDPEAIVRHDVPISYLKRQFAVRYVKTKLIPIEGVEEDDGNISDENDFESEMSASAP